MERLAGPLFIAVCVAGLLSLARYAWRRRRLRGAWPLGLLALTLAVRLVTTELRAHVPDEELLRPLGWLQMVVGAAAPVFTLLFALEVCALQSFARRLRALSLYWPLSVGIVAGWVWAQGGLLPARAAQPYGAAWLLDRAVGHGGLFVALAALSAVVAWAAISRGRERTRAAWCALALFIGGVGPFYDGFVRGDGLGYATGLSWLVECVLFGFVIRRYGALGALPVAVERIFSEMPLGILVVDHRRRVIDANLQAVQWLGLERGAVRGRHLGELGENACQIAELGVGDRGVALDWLVVGQRTSFEVSCAPASDAQGTIIGQVFVLNDVTGRRRAEQLLQQNTEELDRQAAEQTRELARVTADLAAENREIARTTAFLAEAQRVARLGDWSWERSGKVVRLTISRELQHLLGRDDYDPALDLDGVLACLVGEDRATVRRAAEELGTREDYPPFRVRAALPEGHTRWLLLRAGRVLERDADGAPARVLGTAQDVSEACELEQRLGRRGEELQQRVQERSRELVALSRELDEINRLAVESIAPALERIAALVAEVRAHDPGVAEAGLRRIEAAARGMHDVAADARTRADAAVLPLRDR